MRKLYRTVMIVPMVDKKATGIILLDDRCSVPPKITRARRQLWIYEELSDTNVIQ